MTSNDGNASIYEISLPSGARCEIELNEDRQILSAAKDSNRSVDSGFHGFTDRVQNGRVSDPLPRFLGHVDRVDVDRAEERLEQ